MTDEDILELRNNGRSVGDIASLLGVTNATIYYRLSRSRRNSESDIYDGLVQVGASEAEANAITIAVNRADIYTMTELRDYDKYNNLENIYRIGNNRAERLRMIL